MFSRRLDFHLAVSLVAEQLREWRCDDAGHRPRQSAARVADAEQLVATTVDADDFSFISLLRSEVCAPSQCRDSDAIAWVRLWEGH
jgi:hypothetical protein